MWKLVISIQKTKRFLDPNRGYWILELFRWVGTTKVKALDLKQKLQSEWLFTWEINLSKELSLPMSFYVVSVKDRIQKHWEHYVPSVLLPSVLWWDWDA
jgi:hypothetical protein